MFEGLTGFFPESQKLRGLQAVAFCVIMIICVITFSNLGLMAGTEGAVMWGFISIMIATAIPASWAWMRAQEEQSSATPSQRADNMIEELRLRAEFLASHYSAGDPNYRRAMKMVARLETAADMHAVDLRRYRINVLTADDLTERTTKLKPLLEESRDLDIGNVLAMDPAGRRWRAIERNDDSSE